MSILVGTLTAQVGILQIDLCRLTLPQKESFHFILQAVPGFNLAHNVVHNAKLEKWGVCNIQAGQKNKRVIIIESQINRAHQYCIFLY